MWLVGTKHILDNVSECFWSEIFIGHRHIIRRYGRRLVKPTPYDDAQSSVKGAKGGKSGGTWSNQVAIKDKDIDPQLIDHTKVSCRRIGYVLW